MTAAAIKSTPPAPVDDAPVHVDPRARFEIFAAVLLALFLAALDQTIVGTALPRILTDLHGNDLYTWVVTIYLLTSTVTGPLDDGTVRTFDAKSFMTTSTMMLGGDADNVRYDSATGRIVVGYANGALGFVDPKAHKVISSIKLSGHPESFQLEKSRPRIYVNVPNANHIAVIDGSRQAVITTWPVGQFRANFPMALDEAHHRLFVGTRNPAKLVIFDTESGKQITALDISGDTDDVFFDQENKRIYVSAGEGYVDVFTQTDQDHYQPISKISTASGARTSLFVPELRRLFVAVPHRGAQEPAIRVYEAMK